MNGSRGWTEVLALTDRVEIFRSGMENGAPLNDDRVDITEPAEVRELTERLAVTGEADTDCRGSGHVKATEAAGSIPEPMVDDADQRLTQAMPDETARCTVLLAWLGTGTGRLSGHPTYEDIADELVKRLPLSAVKAALKADPSQAVRLGVAKHLARRGHTKQELARINERVIGQLVSEAKLAGWTQVADALRERAR